MNSRQRPLTQWLLNAEALLRILTAAPDTLDVLEDLIDRLELDGLLDKPSAEMLLILERYNALLKRLETAVPSEQP